MSRPVPVYKAPSFKKLMFKTQLKIRGEVLKCIKEGMTIVLVVNCEFGDIRRNFTVVESPPVELQLGNTVYAHEIMLYNKMIPSSVLALEFAEGTMPIINIEHNKSAHYHYELLNGQAITEVRQCGYASIDTPGVNIRSDIKTKYIGTIHNV